jgi:hypothetical protein
VGAEKHHLAVLVVEVRIVLVVLVLLIKDLTEGVLPLMAGLAVEVLEVLDQQEVE